MSLPNPPLKNPGYTAPGLPQKTEQFTIDMATAAPNHPIPLVLPLGAVVLALALHLPEDISATTATRIGVGRSTSVADPDKYFLAPLAKADLARAHNGWGAPIADANGESLALYACANDGSAAGSIGGAEQYAIVSVTYAVPQKIY